MDQQRPRDREEHGFSCTRVIALKKGWWKEVTIVIWGSTAKLAGENGDIQNQIKKLIAEGVHVSACKACADELGVSEALVGLGIEVKYWGAPLTEVIQSGQGLS